MQTHKMFVRGRRDDQFPTIRIYFKRPLPLIEEDIRAFQDEVAQVAAAGSVEVRLHDYFVAIQWMRLETEHENDIVQESLVTGFAAFLQERLDWQVEREDFAFDQLEEVSRREDRVWEWHPST